MRKELKLYSSTPLLLAAMTLSLAACDQAGDVDSVGEAPVAGVEEGILDDENDIGVNDGAFDEESGALDDAADEGGAFADADSGDLDDAQGQVSEAVAVVNQMKQDPELASTLEQAYGVFIVPDFGQAAAVVGGEGGEGVVLLRQGAEPGGEWSAPAFYNFGGISVGAAAGVEAGAIAMLLMSEQAAQMFATEANNFSLDASAGLTIIDWSAKAEGSADEGDVIVWSDTEGLFAGAAIGVTDVNRDEDENAAYYGQDVDAQQILSGNVADDRSQTLRDALSG